MKITVVGMGYVGLSIAVLLSQKYEVYALDIDEDKVSYFFNWGDNTNSGWTEFVDSGVEVTASHNWNKGEYMLEVKARDIYGTESDWSNPLSVSMPRNKQSTDILFQQFLENSPCVF